MLLLLPRTFGKKTEGIEKNKKKGVVPNKRKIMYQRNVHIRKEYKKLDEDHTGREKHTEKECQLQTKMMSPYLMN